MKKVDFIEKSPLEREQMRVVADWLRWHKVIWLHPPNEGKRNPWAAAQLKRQGLLHPGAPDILVFGPLRQNTAGIAVELKREKGSRLTDLQQGWLDALQGLGWATTVAYGAGEAIAFIRQHLGISQKETP